MGCMNGFNPNNGVGFQSSLTRLVQKLRSICMHQFLASFFVAPHEFECCTRCITEMEMEEDAADGAEQHSPPPAPAPKRTRKKKTADAGGWVTVGQ